jgi:hypothetical protein
VNRILKPISYVLAAVYFLVDAVFIAVAKPVSDWLAKHLVLRKLRIWIRSLRPYPSLALFSVPVIILEPVKPVAAYLAATGQIMSSVLTLIVGELLKLVLIERLFSLTRDKLMKIPAFAWAYTKFQQAKAWLEATEAWQAIQTLSRAARNYVAQMKRSGAVRFRQSYGEQNGDPFDVAAALTSGLLIGKRNSVRRSLYEMDACGLGWRHDPRAN